MNWPAIGFRANTTLAKWQNNSDGGWTPTCNGHVHISNIALLSNYMAAFSPTAADTPGNELFTELSQVADHQRSFVSNPHQHQHS